MFGVELHRYLLNKIHKLYGAHKNHMHHVLLVLILLHCPLNVMDIYDENEDEDETG